MKGAIKTFLTLVVLVLGLAYLADRLVSPGDVASRADHNSAKETAADIISRSELVLREWDEFGTKKTSMPPTKERTELAEKALAGISSSAPEHEVAQSLIAKIQAKSKQYEKAALAAEAAAIKRRLLAERRSYAATLEDAYLKKGQDFRIRAEGHDATVLRIQWVLIGRPFVYNAINDRDLMLRWQLMGFKTVIFSDGFDNTWRQPIR